MINFVLGMVSLFLAVFMIVLVVFSFEYIRYIRREIQPPITNVHLRVGDNGNEFTYSTESEYPAYSEPGLYHPTGTDTYENFEERKRLEELENDDPYRDWELPDDIEYEGDVPHGK